MSKAAAAGGSGVGPSRRTWDVEVYTAKARENARRDQSRDVEDEERIRKGEKPLLPQHQRGRLDHLPAPTQHLQRRELPLDLDKDVGKTLLVDQSMDSRRSAGYYCEVCRKTCKDSIGYLDHINGRDHLRRLGQTTHAARSTVEQVRARIQSLRQEMAASKSHTVKEYDFQERVKALAEAERVKKEERKRKKREEKESKEKQASRLDAVAAGATESAAGGGDQAMMSMMGFGGFGSSKK